MDPASTTSVLPQMLVLAGAKQPKTHSIIFLFSATFKMERKKNEAVELALLLLCVSHKVVSTDRFLLTVA